MVDGGKCLKKIKFSQHKHEKTYTERKCSDGLQCMHNRFFCDGLKRFTCPDGSNKDINFCRRTYHVLLSVIIRKIGKKKEVHRILINDKWTVCSSEIAPKDAKKQNTGK